MEEGSSLASITSAEERNAVTKFFNAAELTSKHKQSGIWIGLVSYRDELMLPRWKWTDGSDASNFSSWDTGFPTDLFSTEAQCVFMTKDGVWQNTACQAAPSSVDLPYYYLCKITKVRDLLPTQRPSLDKSQGLSGGGTAAIVIFSLLAVASGVVVFVVLQRKNVNIVQVVKDKITKPVRTSPTSSFENATYTA